MARFQETEYFSFSLTLWTWDFHQCKVQHGSIPGHCPSLIAAGKAVCICSRSFPSVCYLSFDAQTLTPTIVIAPPNLACSDEVEMLIISDMEHGAHAGALLFVKAALSVGISS